MKQKTEKVLLLLRRLLSCGVLSPKDAGDYWRGIINAAICPSWKNRCSLLMLPCLEAERVIGGFESIPVSLTEYQYTYGDMPLIEIVTLCRIARCKEPGLIFEIGTFNGGTTLQLVSNCKAVIYTLDLPPTEPRNHVESDAFDPDSDVFPVHPGVRFHGTQYEHRIHQLLGNSRTFDFSPYYGKVDLVFVDGCHKYDVVLSDSMNALEMVAPGGIVLWHDYAVYEPDVVRVLNELGRDVPLVHIKGTSLVIMVK